MVISPAMKRKIARSGLMAVFGGLVVGVPVTLVAGVVTRTADGNWAEASVFAGAFVLLGFEALCFLWFDAE